MDETLVTQKYQIKDRLVHASAEAIADELDKIVEDRENLWKSDWQREHWGKSLLFEALRDEGWQKGGIRVIEESMDPCNSLIVAAYGRPINLTVNSVMLLRDALTQWLNKKQ